MHNEHLFKSFFQSKPSIGSPFGIEPQGFKPLKTMDLQKRVFHILSKPHLYIEVYKAESGILPKHDHPTQPNRTRMRSLFLFRSVKELVAHSRFYHPDENHPQAASRLIS
jgi:hypothetical protein